MWLLSTCTRHLKLPQLECLPLQMKLTIVNCSCVRVVKLSVILYIFRVLIKFWSGRLGCKSRWLGNQMPSSLFSICQRRRQLNTRSSQFFSRVPALINGNPASRKQPLPVSSHWHAIFIHRFTSEVTLHNNLVDSLSSLQSSSSRMTNGPVLLTHRVFCQARHLH